jgi:spore coat protein H
MQISAQFINPPRGYVFNDSIIPRIDIIIDPNDLELIFEDPASNTEYPATFIFTTPIKSDTVSGVGFRIRGNTSRWSGKKSYKVSFNTYDPEKKFYDLEKMNINGEHNDPSILRAKLCWDLLRYMEVPASRANHVSLYINKAYYGLYLNVEHIDEEFIRARIGDKHGNLYKCLYPADLAYIGANPESYKFEQNGRRAYNLKTNQEYDDYHDLVELIDVINNSPSDQFVCNLKESFNVPGYLKIAAFDVLTGNWDNYSYLKNNFYLCRNPVTGIFEFIPYDLDNTFGVDWFDIDWANRDIYNWENQDEVRPLYEKIMSVSEFRDLFSYYMDRIIDNYFNNDSLFSRIDWLHNKIRPFVINDPYYPLDYGYQISDFDNSLDYVIGAHVKWGIKPFINQRDASARNQLDVNPIKPIFTQLGYNQPELGKSLEIRVQLEDDDPESIFLIFSKNNGTYQQINMFDDGNHSDCKAGDNIWGVTVEGDNEPWTSSFFVRASDYSGNIIDYPCNPIEVDVPVISKDLVINEFCAGNQSVIADNYGEYDDWIEIYNKGTVPVWLGSKFLSDNLLNRDKWKLPFTYLNPGSFILIWADDQPQQGDNHTNFHLNIDSEEIGLFDAPSTGFHLIDKVIYGAQISDHSYARAVDGGITWMDDDSPTPGSSNYIPVFVQDQASNDAIIVYPNPVEGDKVFFNTEVSVRLFDIYGKELLKASDENWLPIDPLIPGVYILLFDDGESIKLIRQ